MKLAGKISALIESRWVKVRRWIWVGIYHWDGLGCHCLVHESDAVAEGAKVDLGGDLSLGWACPQ